MLLSRDLYGATISLVREISGRFGVRAVTADLTDPARYDRLFEEHRPRAVVVETLPNPLLRVLGVPALVGAARRHGAGVIVDNTFTTPVLAQPLRQGADLVVTRRPSTSADTATPPAGSWWGPGSVSRNCTPSRS